MTKPCACGSSEPRRDLYDARGIFVAYVCDWCEARVRQRYRPDIFTNPDYWHDETLDEDGQ